MAKVPESRRALLYKQPPKKMASSCSTVVVSLDGSSKKVLWETQQTVVAGREGKEKASVIITLPGKAQGLVTRATQTDYRESEAQTTAWRHEVKAEEHTLQQLLSLDWLSSDDFSVGMSEVRRIEAIRQQLAWENVIRRLRGAENEERRRVLVARTAGTVAAERGRRKAAEEEERMEMARGEMRARREEEEEKVRWKMARAYEWRKAENEAKIEYWHHLTARIHMDKSSDIYASKLRDGGNPSLGHEVIEIQCRYLKRYHGLEILEKHLAKVAHSNQLSKPAFHIQSSPKKIGLCLKKFKERAVEEPPKPKFSGLSVRIPVPPPSPGDGTPSVARPPSDSEEALESASLLLKRLIRGRAVQSEKFLQIFKTAPM